MTTTPAPLVTTGDPGHAVAEHSPVAGLAHDARGGISNPILGMLLFICSEVMFFSGLFAAYFSVRAATRPVAADRRRATRRLTEHFNLHAEPWFAAGLTVDPDHSARSPASSASGRSGATTGPASSGRSG